MAAMQRSRNKRSGGPWWIVSVVAAVAALAVVIIQRPQHDSAVRTTSPTTAAAAEPVFESFPPPTTTQPPAGAASWSARRAEDAATELADATEVAPAAESATGGRGRYRIRGRDGRDERGGRAAADTCAGPARRPRRTQPHWRRRPATPSFPAPGRRTGWVHDAVLWLIKGLGPGGAENLLLAAAAAHDRCAIRNRSRVPPAVERPSRRAARGSSAYAEHASTCATNAICDGYGVFGADCAERPSTSSTRTRRTSPRSAVSWCARSPAPCARGW